MRRVCGEKGERGNQSVRAPDRVYEEEGVIEAGDYDPDLAGVYLLGKDIQRVASAETLDVLTQIIENDFDQLSTAMIKSIRHLKNVEQRVQTRLRLCSRRLPRRRKSAGLSSTDQSECHSAKCSNSRGLLKRWCGARFLHCGVLKTDFNIQ